MEKYRCVKMDTVIRNMLIRALHDVKQEQEGNWQETDQTEALLMKITDYEGKKLFLTDDEHSQIIHALNKLRDTFITAGRFPDGIDIVLLKIIRAKYRKRKKGIV